MLTVHCKPLKAILNEIDILSLLQNKSAYSVGHGNGSNKDNQSEQSEQNCSTTTPNTNEYNILKI